MSKRQENIIIYNTTDGNTSVNLYAKDGYIWMNQSELARLFNTSKPNISMHITNILKDKELEESSVVKDYLTTGSDGKKYNVIFYSLDMILAIGFRVRSNRGIQFRQWANRNLKEYMVKGFVIDDERLKSNDDRVDYFDELLARIRDIRASEKRFYQKIRNLFSLSSDYDVTDKETKMFFAETQNKILFAITGKTAAEIIRDRVDVNKSHMGLTHWQGMIVRKQDIYISKNYLTSDEIDNLNRFVVVFLEVAELRAKNKQDITMIFWRENVDKIIQLNDKELLTHKGRMSQERMKVFVDEVYQEFDYKRKKQEAIEEDERELKELQDLEKRVGENKDEK